MRARRLVDGARDGTNAPYPRALLRWPRDAAPRPPGAPPAMSVISRLAARLQRSSLVRLVRRAFVALALSACGPSEVAPRTPLNAQFIDPTCVDAPAIEDSFPEAVARSQAQASARRPERPPSISLCENGD